MGTIFLAFLITLTHSYVADDIWDNSAEDLFSPEPGIVSDGIFVSSTLPDDSGFLSEYSLGEGDSIVMLSPLRANLERRQTGSQAKNTNVFYS
jgi:hypothetical protein